MNFFSYFETFYIQLRYQASFVIAPIVTALALVLVFGRSLEIRKLPFRFFEAVACWMFGLIVSSLSYWLSDGMQRYDMYIQQPLTILFCAVLFCRYDVKLRIVFGIFFYAIELSALSISQAIGWYTNSWFGGRSPLTFITQAAIIIFISFVLRGSRIYKSKQISNIYCLFLDVISSVHIVLNIYVSERVKNNFTISIILNLGFIIIEIMAFFIYYFATIEMNEKNSVLEMNMRLSRDKYLADVAHSDIEKLRTIRHDMKNNYAYMELLLNNKRYDELDEYFKKYTCELYDSVRFSICGNYTVDYLVSIEIAKAREKNITIDYNIAVAPTLPVNESDLCSLITNIIDNAIEAVERNETLLSEERKIYFTMTQKGESLIIHAENPVSEGYVFVYKTSKADKVCHGLGLKIINNVAKKYKGASTHRTEEGKFITDVMLSLAM